MIDALRRGAVPESGLDLLATGLGRFEEALDTELGTAASGGSVFKAVRGEYGSGIDVGDLDRVIQIDAPGTVASFLQRLGRTGRRHGSTRNCLFLTLDEAGLLSAAALLLLWKRGWVEPVVAPPDPRHIVAQQILALCLQEHRVGDRLWQDWWGGLGPFGPASEPIARHLAEAGFLSSGAGLMFIGPEAERRFGYRHFMDLTAVFTAAPEFTVLADRTEIGTTDPALLGELVDPEGTVLLRGGHDTNVRWWTWAGYKANATPAASLASVADPLQRPTDMYVRLREDLTLREWTRAKADAGERLSLPVVDPRALNGMKFSAALPPRLAEATLSARMADLEGAAAALGERVRFTGQIV